MYQTILTMNNEYAIIINVFNWNIKIYSHLFADYFRLYKGRNMLNEERNLLYLQIFHFNWLYIKIVTEILEIFGDLTKITEMTAKFRDQKIFFQI